MNYPLLKSYIKYEPYIGDPQEIVDNIILQAQSYITSHTTEQIAQIIQDIYIFTKQAHGDGLRLSGEQYIVHPLLATKFLLSIKPDLDTIGACILHDVIEDTEYTYIDICDRFGKTVADLCEGMVKVSKLKYRGEERQIETIKKTFFAFSKDLRVIFIKLVDRIHNIQTLHYHPNPEKQARIAQETLTIYVPIAKRLGLYEFQSLLENGSFRILYPDQFDRIVKYLDNKYIINSTIIDDGVKDLNKILKSHNIQGDIKGRIKSPYRIREKLGSHDNNFDRIYDILAFRIIAKDIGDCYQVLGLLHNQFTPLDKRFKDYIAVAKDNGYKSIHTTVLGLFKFPVEIQIRTPEMDEYADYGVAAHFAYSDAGSKLSKVDKKQSERVVKIQEIVENYQEDNEGFKESMNIELLDDNIYIYTPKGDVIELSKNSTVLDFAFRIHSNIGLRFRGATVNGSMVPIDYKLKNGDIVVIQTRKDKISANPNWLNILHTPSAKNQVNRHFRSLIRDELIQKGKDLLNSKLAEFSLPLLDSKEDQISPKYPNRDNLEDILIDIGEKRIGAHTFINEIYKSAINKITQEQKEEKIQQQLATAKPKSDIIYIDGQLSIPYELCNECCPKSGDMIVAKTGTKGIKIHKINCFALDNIDRSKLLSAQRDEGSGVLYRLNISLKIHNKYGILSKILKILGDLSININSISFSSSNTDWQDGIIIMESFSPSKFGFALNGMQKLSNIIQITQKTFV